MSPPVGHIDFSVIVTLRDDRGHLEECISSWTQRQTFSRHRFEVIGLSSKREAGAATTIVPLLGVSDRVLQHDTDNELLLYDLGARQARGTWLVFTEAHCAAEAGCLAQLFAFLKVHQEIYIGACIRTAPDGNCDPLASAEGRWYREGFTQWSQEDDWRKVTIRGTAIRRDVYERIGGFRSEFGCFAESLLAADLHAGGYRLGYAEQAAVRHYNSTNIRDFLTYICEYRTGEAAYQLGSESEQARHYFEVPQGWRDASAADRRLALRCAVQSLAQAAVHPLEPGAFSLALSMIEVLWHQGWDAAFGRRHELFKAFVAQVWARLCFAMPGPDPEKNYQRFCQLLEATGQLARVRALLRRPAHSIERGAPETSAPKCRIGTAPSGCLVGFHALETFKGQPFRWSSPLALIRLEMKPTDHEVCIDTGGIAGPAPRRLKIYLNGHQLRPTAPWQAGKLRLFAMRHHFLKKGYQKLVLTSEREPIRGSSELRALGIPLLSINFTPKAGVPARPANL
jgi:hypothetical protein